MNDFGPKLTPEARAELFQLRREGASTQELADAFGIDKSAVYYHLRHSGLARLPRPVVEAPAAEDDEPVALHSFRPPDWMDRALCAQTDPEAFFPEKGGTPKDAKRTCARCPVAAECLDFALASHERFGIWGGLTERERRSIAALLEESA